MDKSNEPALQHSRHTPAAHAAVRGSEGVSFPAVAGVIGTHSRSPIPGRLPADKEVVQGRFYTDIAGGTPALNLLKKNTTDLFLSFKRAAQEEGSGIDGMMNALNGDARTHVLLKVAASADAGDYGGATRMRFKISEGNWKYFQQMTAEDWTALPRDVEAAFDIILRYTNEMPITGPNDMRHLYTLVHEFGLHVAPLYELLTKVRNGTAQAAPPVGEVGHGAYSEAAHHDELAHGQSESFSKLFQATQVFVQDHVEGADLQQFWNAHEDDDVKQNVDPFLKQYKTAFAHSKPAIDEIVGLLQRGGLTGEIVLRILPDIESFCSESKAALLGLNALIASKTPAPPPPLPPSFVAPVVAPRVEEAPQIDLRGVELPPVVLPPNSPFGWSAASIESAWKQYRAIYGSYQKVEPIRAALVDSRDKARAKAAAASGPPKV